MSDLKKDLPETISLDKNIIFKLNPDKSTSEVKLKSAEWQIILQIDGKKNLLQIINEVEYDEREVLTHIKNLAEEKLIIQETSPEPVQDVYVDQGIFIKIKTALVDYIGPVAPYVINDVLAELNEDQDKFLKENVPLLIESLSQEILDDTKRVKFQREMLEVIKGL